MKKAKTEIMAFAAGTLEDKECALARVTLGRDTLLVVRPKRKAAVLRANALMAKMGWKPSGPWEEPK